MTNINILKDKNNSTTTTEETTMNTRFLKVYNFIKEHFGVELKEKCYRDVTLQFEKEYGGYGKTVISICFKPEEDKEWKQRFLTAWRDSAPEVILSEPETEKEEEKIKKEIKLFADKMNRIYHKVLEPYHHFYESVEEIKEDYGDIENVKIVVKYKEMFVEYITERDVEIWRNNRIGQLVK